MVVTALTKAFVLLGSSSVSAPPACGASHEELQESPCLPQDSVTNCSHFIAEADNCRLLLLAPLGSRSAGLAWSVSWGCCPGPAGVAVTGGLPEMLGQPDLCLLHVVSGPILCLVGEDLQCGSQISYTVAQVTPKQKSVVLLKCRPRTGTPSLLWHFIG